MSFNKINWHVQHTTFKKPRPKTKYDWLINAILSDYDLKLENIDYVFCTNEFLLEINKNHLKHDYYTDIICFDYTSKNQVKAEIYLSVDMIHDNALEFKTTFKNELLRVMIHGALHICGYTDKTEKEKEIMRLKENYYIEKFNAPRETKKK
jgi:probable rRNA maturation factor